MKKFFQIFAVVAVAILLANCGGKKGPEAVAEKFLNHLNKKEYAEAKKLGTEATVKMISFLEQFPSEEAAKEVKIENMKCTVEGETANCDFTKNGEADKVKLVKENGEWKVDMPKETPPTEETTTQPEGDQQTPPVTEPTATKEEPKPAEKKK